MLVDPFMQFLTNYLENIKQNKLIFEKCLKTELHFNDIGEPEETN